MSAKPVDEMKSAFLVTKKFKICLKEEKICDSEEYTKNMLLVKPTCTENTDLQLSVLDESDWNKNKFRINILKEMACFSTAQEAALIKAASRQGW